MGVSIATEAIDSEDICTVDVFTLKTSAISLSLDTIVR